MGDSSGSDSSQSQTYPKGKAGTPPMGKEKTDKGGNFAKGGSQHMLTGMTAGPQVAGQSASEGKGGGKYASGGSGHMFGEQHAGPQQAGESGHSTSGDGGKFAAGGKGSNNHMFGPQTAKPASPA